MKNFLMFTVLLVVFGCSKSDEGSDEQLGSGPWDYKCSKGNLKISREPIVSHAEVWNLEEDIGYICRDLIPNKPLILFQYNIYVPTYLKEGYSTDIEKMTSRVIYDNKASESVDVGLYYDSQIFDEITGVENSVFKVVLFNRNVNIYRENIQRIEAEYEVVYKDDLGKELYRGKKQIVYNVSDTDSPCSPNSGIGKSNLMIFTREYHNCNNGIRVKLTGIDGYGEKILDGEYDYYAKHLSTDCETTDPNLVTFTYLDPGTYTISAKCNGQQLFPPETIELWPNNCQAYEFKMQ